MILNRKWAFASVLALGTAVAFAAVGCGDDSTTATPKDGGTKDTGTSNNTVDGSTFDTPDGSVFSNDAGTTLYERLGKRAGIAAAVKEVVEGAGGEAADPQIASYFAIRTGNTSNGGDPSFAVVEDCFTQFVAKAVGGPEAYPYTSTFDGGSFVCRDMGPAHLGLGITSAAFQKFLTIAAAKLGAAGVSSADIQSLGGALLGTASAIVDAKRVGAQFEAGVDASFNYSARCSDIEGGAAAVPACNPSN
jgi:hypothetical protein